MIELNGVRRHLHAYILRKYQISVGEVSVASADCNHVIADMSCNQCAVVYESDNDFGDLNVIDSAKLEADLLPSPKITLTN